MAASSVSVLVKLCSRETMVGGAFLAAPTAREEGISTEMDSVTSTVSLAKPQAALEHVTRDSRRPRKS